MEQKIKHAVLMVSYNQIEYINRALDSIFDNIVKPDKVIIFDDHSRDGTWEVIKKYQFRYPDIILAKRNLKNLGVFENINSVWIEGIRSGCHVLSWCSGDDFLEKGIFQELNNAINTNGIDVEKDKFIIVTNSALYYPNGKIVVWNNYKLKGRNLTRERLAKKLSYREVGVSINILKENFEPLRSDIGLTSDLLFVLKNEMKCNKWIFLNRIGAYYRVNVGVVVKEKTIELVRSENLVYKHLLENEFQSFNKNELKIIRLWFFFTKYIYDQSYESWAKYVKELIYNIIDNYRYLNLKMVGCILPPKIVTLLLMYRQKIKMSKMEKKK